VGLAAVSFGDTTDMGDMLMDHGSEGSEDGNRMMDQEEQTNWQMLVENASGCLWNMTQDEAGTLLAVEHGVIDELALLLCPQVLRASDAVELTGIHPPHTLDRVVCPLVCGAGLENISGALWNISTVRQARAHCRSAHVLDTIVHMLMPSQCPLVEVLTKVTLAGETEREGEREREGDTAAHLSLTLQTILGACLSPPTITNLTGCIRNLCINDTNKHALLKLGGVHCLLGMVADRYGVPHRYRLTDTDGEGEATPPSDDSLILYTSSLSDVSNEAIGYALAALWVMSVLPGPALSLSESLPTLTSLLHAPSLDRGVGLSPLLGALRNSILPGHTLPTPALLDGISRHLAILSLDKEEEREREREEGRERRATPQATDSETDDPLRFALAAGAACLAVFTRRSTEWSTLSDPLRVSLSTLLSHALEGAQAIGHGEGTPFEQAQVRDLVGVVREIASGPLCPVLRGSVPSIHSLSAIPGVSKGVTRALKAMAVSSSSALREEALPYTHRERAEE
ncbi:hypothetical protein KIPB_000477, partial [Kipferlia bialata]